MRVPAKQVGTRTCSTRSRAGGFNLVELLVVMTVLGLMATVGIPRVLEWTRHLKVDLASRELVGVLRLARSYAVRHSTKVGVKFRPAAGSKVTFTLHRDADGDGVLTSDIDAGVDPAVGPPRELAHFGAQVRFGFPPGRAPRDPGDISRRLTRLHDPIRFNRSDIASFNHLGGSTPGSLYITDGRELLSVIRVYGRTGKVKVLRYDARSETWR